MSQALALPRAKQRVKRRRPPSNRLVYTLIFIGSILLNLTATLKLVAAGQWWMIILVFAWIALYRLSVKLHRHWREFEERFDRPASPARPIEWMCVTLLYVVGLTTLLL